MVQAIWSEGIPDRAVDPSASVGHESVEAGATDEGEVGVEGDGGDDVGAVHDAGVEDDLNVATDLAGH